MKRIFIAVLIFAVSFFTLTMILNVASGIVLTSRYVPDTVNVFQNENELSQTLVKDQAFWIESKFISASVSLLLALLFFQRRSSRR